MLGRSADTAARTDHSFDKVFLQAVVLQKQERLAAFIAARALPERDVGGILPHFLHNFHHCLRDAS